jgi:protein-tyrosine phosphatase
MKLLMVCLGNICRSPIAEGIVKEKLKKSGFNAAVDSAGLLSYHIGETPDPRAIKIAARFGIDISNQRARQILSEDFDRFDIIFAMDQSVFDALKSLSRKEQRNKIHLFLEFAGYPAGSNVPDPYYGNMSDFEECFRLIDSASDIIIKKILSLKKDES